MLSVRDRADAAGIPYVQRSGSELFALDDAKRLVEVAREQGLIILSFEGFFLQGGSVVPDCQAIADFSDMCDEPGAVASTAESAIRALERCGTAAHYFEVVMMPGDDPNRRVGDLNLRD
jgi:hypothetical protein